MIEIKTQKQFNNINNIIANLDINIPDKIRIHALEKGEEYILNSTIIINRNNVVIEGVNKPIIKSNITGTTMEDGSMIYCFGAENSELENIIIRNIKLIGNNKYYGIYCKYAGKTFTTGLTSNTYSRYDESTVGNTHLNKIGIKIQDCVIQNNNYGIYLGSSSNNTISGNIVSNNNNYGIYLYSSSNNTISGNIVSNNNNYGIYLGSSSNNTISGNTIQNNNGNNGIYLNSSSNNNTISGNTIQNNNYKGIYLSSSSNNTISGNIVSNNGNNGIYLNSSSNNTISGNIIQNNNSDGIYLGSSSNNIISGNTIQNNNSCGIKVVSGKYINIVSNIIKGNNIGISISSTVNYSIIYGNVSINNVSNNYIDEGDIYFSMEYNE